MTSRASARAQPLPRSCSPRSIRMTAGGLLLDPDRAHVNDPTIGAADGDHQCRVGRNEGRVLRLSDRHVESIVDRDSLSDRKKKRAILQEASGDEGDWQAAKRRPEPVSGCGVASPSPQFFSEDVPELQADERRRHERNTARLSAVQHREGRRRIQLRKKPLGRDAGVEDVAQLSRTVVSKFPNRRRRIEVSVALEEAETQGINLLAGQGRPFGRRLGRHSGNNSLKFGKFRGRKAFDMGEEFGFAHGMKDRSNPTTRLLDDLPVCRSAERAP